MLLTAVCISVLVAQVLSTQASDVNRIKSLNVKCGDQDMLVDIEFNQPFNGIIFSKGYFARSECAYVKANPSKYTYEFTIAYSACGTTAGGSGVPSTGARRSDGFLRSANDDSVSVNRTRREAGTVVNASATAEGRSLFGGMEGGGMGMYGAGGGSEFPQGGDPYAPQMQGMDYSGGMGVGGGGMMGDPYSGGQQQSWQPNPASYGGGAPQYGNINYGGNQQLPYQQSVGGNGGGYLQQPSGGMYGGSGSNTNNGQQQWDTSNNNRASQQNTGVDQVSQSQSGVAASFPGSASANQQSSDSDIQSESSLSKTNEPFGEDKTGGSSRFFENIIIIQYDANIQEVWDVAKALRCEWHDNYHKTVTYKPFQVDSLEVVPATFAGDNVGVWMTVQQGKGPYAPEVNGIVRIGEYLTLAIGIQDQTKKFDMRVINCFASDGVRPAIQLIDEYGCITRPKIMSDIAKVTNYGDQASVVAYAYFQAFKFPDSVDVHLECSVEICKFGCAKQCYTRLSGETAVSSKLSSGLTSVVSSGLSFGSSSRGQQGRKIDQSPRNDTSLVQVSSASVSGKSVSVSSSASSSSASGADANMQSVDSAVLNSLKGGRMIVKVATSAPIPKSGGAKLYSKMGSDDEDELVTDSTTTTKRRLKAKKVTSADGDDDSAYRRRRDVDDQIQQNVGIKRTIRVVSPGDLSFFDTNRNNTVVYASAQHIAGIDNVCISSPGFVAGIVVLIALLLLTTLTSLILCLRIRSLDGVSNKQKQLDMEYIKHTL